MVVQVIKCQLMATVQDQDHQTEGQLLAGVQDDVDEDEAGEARSFACIHKCMLDCSWYEVMDLTFRKLYILIYASDTYTLKRPNPDGWLVTVLESLSQRIDLLHCFMNPVCF